MKEIVCRFCGDAYEGKSPDAFSNWTHHHPEVCPHRQDRVPSLNGVHVGDVWENLHTENRITISEIRLGGAGIYTDREPIVRSEEEHSGMGGWPLWSLVEHWKPITRPGEYPVPWHYDKRFGKGSRSASSAWRCPGYRGHGKRRKYFHAYHSLDGHGSTGWGSPWQEDTKARVLRSLPAFAEAHPEIAEVVRRVEESLKVA